jgi:hypothetical protein
VVLLRGTSRNGEYAEWYRASSRCGDDDFRGYHCGEPLNHGAPGADSRSLRYSCPFLIAVLVAVAEYRVVHAVLSDAARAGQSGEVGQDRAQ